MAFFECCKFCPDTKRHPGCHSTCKDYIEQKDLFDKHKESERQKKLREQTVQAVKFGSLYKKKH